MGWGKYDALDDRWGRGDMTHWMSRNVGALLYVLGLYRMGKGERGVRLMMVKMMMH